jgi:hypothetical protein
MREKGPKGPVLGSPPHFVESIRTCSEGVLLEMHDLLCFSKWEVVVGFKSQAPVRRGYLWAHS